MENKNLVVVEYLDGCANVSIGESRLSIGKSGQDHSDYFCPVDLISASLGS
jgi:hypothetical protein